jgi:hypothetical protein
MIIGAALVEITYYHHQAGLENELILPSLGTTVPIATPDLNLGWGLFAYVNCS